MNSKIAKWGNSLAVRIPSSYVRSMGIKEGDQIKISMTADGGMCIRAAKSDRKALATELGKLRASMPIGESVMDEVRQGARY